MERPELGETLFTAEEIEERVNDIARRINEDYAGKELFMVGVLKGAFTFMADLVRKITVPLEIDFVALSSYGSGTKTSGVVRIHKDLDTDIRGRHVLLVEDIIDTGLTLSYFVQVLRAREPASIEICALLEKDIEKKADLPVKYVGFKIPDVYVVGYGLDAAQAHRELPHIKALKE